MWRSSISLMLVFCMLVSMAPAAFATDSSEPTTIKYVSLGDSVSLGSGSYPNLFASWLEAEGYADDVDHTALAMDAMRAEDLHFILAYGGANSAVGDDYTRKNFTSVEDFDINETAQQYQTAVAAADLLTVGIGNANFGDFLMDCAMDAVNGDLAWVDVETAMGDLNASLRSKLMTVYNELLAKLEAKFGNEMAASLANAMVYTMVGYVVNYEAVLNDIVGLNPDAEVIIVPVINTMDGIQISYNGNTYDIGGYIDDGLKVLNAYLAALPAALQAAGKYPDAVFYYAEVGAVQLQGNAVTLSRADIMETVVGEEENPGMIWEMLAGKVGDFYAGAELVYITEAQVEEYAALETATEKANYVIDEATNEVDDAKVDLAISLSLYLAFEEAIKASQGKALSVEGMKDLANPEALIDDVVSDITAELDKVSEDAENKKAAEDAAYDVVADKVNKEIYNTLTNEGVDKANAASVTLTVDEVKALLAGGTEADAIIDDLSYEIAVAGIKSKLNISTDEANSIGLNVEGIKAIVANDPAAEALLNDLAYRGMAKTIADGDEDILTGEYAAYSSLLDEYTEVRELYENSNRVYKLVADEVNKQLCESDKLDAADIAGLVNGDPAANDKLDGFAANKIDQAIKDIYDQEAGNANTSLKTEILNSQDIVDLYHGDEDTVKQKAYSVIYDAAEDKELFEILYKGEADYEYAAAVHVLNKNIDVENGDVAWTVDTLKAAESVNTDVAAAIQQMRDSRTELLNQYASVCDTLRGIKNTVTDRVAAQNIPAEIEARKKQIVDGVNQLEKLKAEGLDKAKNDKDGIVDTINTKLAEAKTKLNDKIYNGEDYEALVNENIDNLCKMLGISDAVVAVVKDNDTLSGLLNIMARCVIGDGLGMLPTAAGHNTIAVAVETSYKTRHTVQDETKENVELAIDKVIEILEENGMMIVDKATIQKGLEYITDLDKAVALLKAELQDQIDDYKNGVLPALQGDLAAMQTLLSELESKLTALESKLTTLENKLDNIKNKPDSAASTIEALEKAIDETNAAIAATKEKIAFINKCIADLNEKLGQINTTLGKMQTAIDDMEAAVKALYNAVSTKDISFHDAFNNLEELRAAAIEAVYAVKDLYHELKDLGKDAVKFIDTVKDEAKTAVTLVGGALYAAYKLLPNSIEEKIRAEADAKIETLKAQIAEKKDQLAQEVKEEVKAELQKEIDALEAEIKDIKAKADEEIENLGGLNADVVALINDILDETRGLISDEYANVENAFKTEVDTKNEVIEASAQALKNLIKFAEEQVEKVVEEAKAIYANVSSADYIITNSSSYVALGDASAYSASGSYVDILAADPQLALEEAYKNAYSTRTIDEMLADIRGGDVADEVKTSDLITIRFDNSQIVKNAFIHAFTYMKGAEVKSFGWEDLIGAKGVEAVNVFLSALSEKLKEHGMEDMKLFEMVDGATLPAEGRTLDEAFVHMAEAYLYYSIQYMFSIPEYVAEIRKLNSDAVIVFVGMSNPFGDTVLTHENLKIEIGSYVGTIVDYVDMIGKVFCMLFPNATYVSAQDVETNASNIEMDLTQFFMTYVQDQNSTLYPTANGHQYIKNQILKALNITDERSKGLWGDADENGVVNLRDAMMVLAVANMHEDVVINRYLSDVTGDGTINLLDAMWILKRANQHPDLFPVEK